MTRREFLKQASTLPTTLCFVLFLTILLGPWAGVTWSAGTNVLFIAIDDLNDWVGFLGGHPQVKTPNMDRLAQRGVAFANAHCAAPLCCPSRAAVFSGQQLFTTGIYHNGPNIRKLHPNKVLSGDLDDLGEAVRRWATEPVISTFDQGNYSIGSDRWRLIRYKDGSEELYNHKSDPHEWHNLAGDARYEHVRRSLEKRIPVSTAAPLGR